MVVTDNVFWKLFGQNLSDNYVTKVQPGCQVLLKVAATMFECLASLIGDKFHKENLHFRGGHFGEWLNVVQGFFEIRYS